MKRIYRIGLLVLMALGLFIYISRVKKQSPEVKITTESLKN